ncbi:hypothetical protein INS49_014283 [Diaporthe citri]|uniref:uncharacterized protein n=1 Tax=Diaporthe citri TaxID=83186 RepID=UPI001C824D0E|nr:uncharacterized protein INS49_014283 [Diaporthe citri]KAG6358399.1 hypothetical protein INS49_014283 [Diaporthe citri]
MDDLPAAKVARTSEATYGDVEAANECVVSESQPQPEEESSDDDIQEIPTPTKPKPTRKPRAWPQPAEPITAGHECREALNQTDKIWNKVGGVSPVFRYTDSLILELMRLRLDRDDKNPKKSHSSDGGFLFELHTYAQDAGGKVAALDARLKGRPGKRNQVREGQVPRRRPEQPMRGAARVQGGASS